MNELVDLSKARERVAAIRKHLDDIANTHLTRAGEPEILGVDMPRRLETIRELREPLEAELSAIAAVFPELGAECNPNDTFKVEAARKAEKGP